MMKNSKDRIRAQVMGKILPDHTISFLSLGLFFLFASPLLVYILFPSIALNPSLFAAVFVSFAIFFSLFSTVAGIFVMGRRNPHLQEWKEKFGYEESKPSLETSFWKHI